MARILKGLIIDDREWLPIQLVSGWYGIKLEILMRAAKAGAITSREMPIGRFTCLMIPADIAPLIQQYYSKTAGIIPHPCLRG